MSVVWVRPILGMAYDGRIFLVSFVDEHPRE